MRQVRTRHWACGTEVVEPVPEGYDLSEGLALVCPRCRDAWWYYPEPEPALAAAPAQAAVGTPEVETVMPPPAAAEAEPLPPGPPPRDQRRGPRAVAARPVNGLVRVALGILMLAAIAVLVLALADPGPLRDEPPSAPPRTAAAPNPPPAASRPPAVQAPATVRVAGRGFTLRRPRGWLTYRRGSVVVVAPSRRAPISLRVFSSRRPDLSLPRMARLSARTLRSRRRGAALSGPARVRLAGRPALRVTARRGATVRQMTVVAAGARRYRVEVRIARGATAAHRSAIAAVERSLRVRS